MCALASEEMPVSFLVRTEFHCPGRSPHHVCGLTVPLLF